MRRSLIIIAVVAMLGPSCSSRCDTTVVDEPLGARYSLGMTLWHMGHNARTIGRFHEYVKARKITPEKAVAAHSMKPPEKMVRILVEPELLDKENRSDWAVDGNAIKSGPGDAGSTATIPLNVPRAGLYRLWVRYQARPNSRGVMFLKIYRAGQEQLGPICQQDEVYDQPSQEAGPAWKDMLVDLPAGDLVLKLGHVTRWWHGGGAYDWRIVDCIYLTDEIWAAPPTADARKAMRQSAELVGIQWTYEPPLSPDDLTNWKWWQVRPLSWEDAKANPRLFAMSRDFWKGIVEELSHKEYEEAKKPDYRAPERQVVFNETWNMVANPVRARRQIKVLTADITREPLGYNYVWHDVGGNIIPPESKGEQGSWSWTPGGLTATWGDRTGTVATCVPVTVPGTYSVWVQSHSNNTAYTAPWFGKVYADGKEQISYHHEGKIPSIWMKMGQVTATRPGPVRVEFILDKAGFGGTYRNIFAMFLVDDASITPSGTVRPPWTMAMYRARATGAGAEDRLLLWLSDTPYRRLSQEVWTDASWPGKPVTGATRVKEMLVAQDTCTAVQINLRNLADTPITLAVAPGPLKGDNGRFDDAVTWKVVGFIPYSSDRQNWTPFFLLRRPNITVPPLNVAGAWLTVDTHGVPAGEYETHIRLRGEGTARYTVTLKVRVAPVKPEPEQPVLIDGYTGPHEGEAYLRDFVEHGMNVWPGQMSKADMRKWGIRLLHLHYGSTEGIPRWLDRLKALGLDYEDYFVAIRDEPGGGTEEALKPYLDVAKAIRAVDPKVRVSFNPSEAAELATFQVLAPYCDFWVPYAKHVFAPHWGNPEKWKIFHPKPWMWYTTPCLWDKTAGDPGIRTAPSQPGNCVGVAIFALNYPWRDQWDTAYEHLADASTMGAVMSRHGPVPTIVWEQIREASQTANLAMMVRERLGAKTFDDVTDPKMQRLIREGTTEELITWLEEN